MAHILKLKKIRNPSVSKGIKTVLKNMQEELSSNGCDSAVVIMSKGSDVLLLSYGKGAIHRAGLCEYGKHTLISSLERI